MIEIVLLAILALVFVGGYFVSVQDRDPVSQMWPVKRAEPSKSEPAEEGAPVPEGEPNVPAGGLRKAA